MDSSSVSLIAIVTETFDMRAQLERDMAGSPDTETVAALDRAVAAGAQQLGELGSRLAAVARRGNAAMAALLAELMDLNREDFALVAQLAAPEQLLAWLSAVASTLLALGSPSHDRGPDLLLLLVKIVNTIVAEELFERHCEALQTNSGLQHNLVQVLTPALHVAAVAVQLPADRRPREFSWLRVVDVIDALTSEALFFTFCKQLASSSGGISTLAQRVLQSTFQLVSAAPESCPDDLTSFSFADLWCSLSCLLGATCGHVGESILQQQQRGVAVPDFQRQKMVRLLLPALSRLPTALRVGEEHGTQDAEGCAGAEIALHRWKYLLQFLPQLRVQEAVLSADHSSASADDGHRCSMIDSLADISEWCAAGTALLQALPHAVTVSALADQQKQAEEQPDAILEDGVPEEIDYVACGIVDEIATYCCTVASGSPWSAAHCAAAGEALWQLHTALCRCICSVAAGSMPMPAISVSPLYQVLAAAVYVSAAQPSAADGVGGARHLLAMSVGQAEAVLVAAVSFQPAPADDELAAVLLSAIEHGPAALVGSPPVQQALQGLADRLGAVAEASDATAALHAEVSALLHREPQPGDGLELAQAAATRSCAYLRCANLDGEGGPAAGQGAGSGAQNAKWPGTAAPPARMPTGGLGTGGRARRWGRRGLRGRRVPGGEV
ncbi:hypothetical protein D9Q98_003630 [Chlorella vulgaris]|uniref:Uncharacterized protein n=1 Tax=Chlorella vulgaris TaxID=3077 RepID=A0A9D4TT97_CHLVU|nr:hypothetical protein D9Q98_003630 [Chlorella vulgaris]